jgi:type II secretory pathway predicted ATPase ExeA
MYEAFFNLKNKPFSLLPDPEFLFLSSRHAIGLSLLEYSLTGQAGFCVITGEIGSGKTTLVRAFLGRVGREFTVGLISNTHSSLKDVAAWALSAFAQKPTGSHPSETYQQLMEFLIAEYGAGRQCILIVDEAQNLSIEALEELRLLSNINSGKDLLLQVVLVGQPELLEKLKRPELSQFAQRIAISHHLTPLPYQETRRYIEHRAKIAGADHPLFTEMAMGAVQYFSGGLPRLINSICDLALVYAFADEKPAVTEEIVFRVVSDRQMSGIAPFAQPVPADDSSVRAEIMKLANLGAAHGEAPGPAKTALRDADSLPTPTPAPPLSAVPSGETVEAGGAPPSAMPDRVVEPIDRPTAKREAPAVETRGSNPYFFRDSREDDELLLTAEMNDSPVTAYSEVRPARRTGSSDSTRGDAEHPIASLRPSRSKETDESPKSDLDPIPLPSGNDLRQAMLFSPKDHGTGTPPRRSWWRRSGGHKS